MNRRYQPGGLVRTSKRQGSRFYIYIYVKQQYIHSAAGTAVQLLLRVLFLFIFLVLLRRNRGWVFTLVSRGLAPVFSTNPPFFVAPPLRHVNGAREGCDGGLSCHIDFFVSPPPSHTGGTRQIFDGWFALL